jgi:hypothetical protein
MIAGMLAGAGIVVASFPFYPVCCLAAAALLPAARRGFRPLPGWPPACLG